MPSSLLFGINNEGRVYTLSTTGTMWRELPYVGQEFKKLSAVPHFLWALGGDHQIYVYVHGLDIPIRVREEAYENERWIPIEGFTNRLLPTDRYHFSSVDGTVDRSIDKIRLPSMAWQWEGDWQLELTLNGQPLDHNGWTYAVDFPAQYYPKKQWKSCVRRRLWVRSRRYSAMNSWCAIAPLHKDATNEPFIDISVGGQTIAGAEPGTMVVWAVTSHNRVMFRTGVSTRSPEGARWNSISVPLGCEVNQLSTGPTGLVWAVLLDGRALVRLGITRDCLCGESWVEVRGPGDALRMTQLSVGLNAVWAVTQNKQVWFRKGIKGEGAGMSEELAAGCGWVEMVGNMSLVTVASNDQVWSVGSDDRQIYFRCGVSSADLTGKRWRALHAPLQLSRASSNASLNRDKDKFHSSYNTLNRPNSIADTSRLLDWEEQSHSAPTAPTSLPVGDLSAKYESQPKNPKAWSPVRSVGSVVGTEVYPDVDQSIWNSVEKADSSIFAEDEELGWAEYEAPWSWVEAGACSVDVNQLPNWFAEEGFVLQAELNHPWRIEILDKLRERLPSQDLYSEYELPVDTASWVHSSEARVNLNSSSYIDCIVQLEWVHTYGTITILNLDGATTMHQFSVSDIVCVHSCSEPGNPRLALQTPQRIPPVVHLQFASDTLMEEWQSHLATVCEQLHEVREQPSDASIWAVTTLGDIFVWDSTSLRNSQSQNDKYAKQIDLSGKEVPLNIPLHADFEPGMSITITGCIGDDADRIAFNLESYSTYKLRHKAYVEIENCCLHINPRFTENCVVRNSMVQGNWGEEERDGKMPLAKGQEFLLKITCTRDEFQIIINDKEFATYKHRIPPNSISSVKLWGKMQPFTLIIESPKLMIAPLDMFWRQIGGHLRKIETCKLGVTWGIGFDHTAWVYTGGWGGGFISALDSNNIHPMIDSQDYRVYENQRWNPVTGYTSAGLPTDRYMWSDASGKQRRTRDHAKLLSMRWQWVSDWLVDFHVPGGVDKEGWQYAVDFPSTFHGHKHFTDYVRRRRWYRRCAITTSGPWQELGHTKLLDLSLCEIVSDDLDSVIIVWALATGGQAIVRTGVSCSSPLGSSWEHINSDQPLNSISVGPYHQVWATGKNGCAYLRKGITQENLQGDNWVCVEPPKGSHLKQISVGAVGVWAVDEEGRLHVRKEITGHSPEGTYWQVLTVDPLVTNFAPNNTSFKTVSVGKGGMWAVTDGGVLLKRIGICTSNPCGSGWDAGLSAAWKFLSIRGLD